MDKAKEYLSLGHYFFSKLDAEFKDRIIFIDVTSGREWTGGQLKDKVLSVAAALKDLHGFEQGTVVCISYTNSDLTLILALAVISLGGIVASAYSKDPYPELLYLARKVEPKYLFCHANNLQWARQLETDMGYPVTAITMEQLPQAEDDTCSKDKFHFHHLYNYLLEGRNQSSDGSLQSIPASCKTLEEDICVILMSSGTTGKPKAIPVTHLNCISELLALEQRGFRQPGIRFACSASLDYVSGRLIMFGSIAVGYTSIIIDGFEPKSYLEAVQRYKINIIYIGAASFYNLITYKNIDKYDISSVKIVFPMGARVIYLKELADFFAKHPHIVQVKQGFGASELAGGAMKTMTPDEYIKNAECCGQLMSGMEAKLVDPETGELVPGPNKPGMLHMRGSTMFPGYYDMELVRRGISESPFVKDASVFDAEGYYITGDLAYFNEHEELFILGRKKETMCCRACKKVLPQELEEIIAQHLVVSKVCVLGIPNKVEKTLDCPRAFVVPDADWSRKFVDWKENNSSSEDNVAEERCKFEGTNKLCRVIESDELRRTLMVDLMSFVDKRVGWEKQLTGGLVFIDDMPTLRETGKVNKSYLRSLDLDQIEVYGDRSSSGG